MSRKADITQRWLDHARLPLAPDHQGETVLRCQVKGNGFALPSPAGLCLWAAAAAERAGLGPSHPSAPTVSGSLSLVLK